MITECDALRVVNGADIAIIVTSAKVRSFLKRLRLECANGRVTHGMGGHGNYLKDNCEKNQE
jgi:hypothetical protein